MQVLPQTRRIVNKLYRIKLRTPEWDSSQLAANIEALKLQLIKTHKKLKGDISDVSFFFLISRYY